MRGSLGVCQRTRPRRGIGLHVIRQPESAPDRAILSKKGKNSRFRDRLACPGWVWSHVSPAGDASGGEQRFWLAILILPPLSSYRPLPFSSFRVPPGGMSDSKATIVSPREKSSEFFCRI